MRGRYQLYLLLMMQARFVEALPVLAELQLTNPAWYRWMFAQESLQAVA